MSPTLAVHGHFYQPDRRDPATGLVPEDPSAAPAPNWNERITTECYRPSALAGNFARIGWDAGPTLLVWLREAHPDVHAALALAAGPVLPPRHRSGIRRPVSYRGAMAQGFHHAILPLAAARDRRTEIVWGNADFALRFGREPEGFWLPECAADTATLADLADAGIRYVILAPWQAASPVDTRRPYRIDLPEGRSIIAFFYDGGLSGDLSFRDEASANADRFVHEWVLPRAAPLPDGSDPIVLVATDGELYGHHKPFRDWFLRALPDAAARAGIAVRTVGDIAAGLDPASLQAVRLAERTSWSCHHGVARWGEVREAPDGSLFPGDACWCTGESAWKPLLRTALDRASRVVDRAMEGWFAGRGLDFWAMRDRYAPVAAGFVSPASFAWAALAGSVAAGDEEAVRDAAILLDGARSRLAAYTSCGWFWDDPSRQEAVTCLSMMAHAVAAAKAVTGTDAGPALAADLSVIHSRRTGESGRDLYRRAGGEA